MSTARTAIAQTGDGFIWIGGYGGLVRYDGKRFDPCMQGKLGTVQALLSDDLGRLWIAVSDVGSSGASAGFSPAGFSGVRCLRWSHFGPFLGPPDDLPWGRRRRKQF